MNVKHEWSRPCAATAVVAAMSATMLCLANGPATGYTQETLDHPIGVVDRVLFDDAASVGSYWMRVPVQWKYVEPLNDQFSWGAYDNWVAQMDARNINMSPVVVIGKVWANWQPGDPWSPTDPPENLPEFDGSAAGASRKPNDLLAVYSSSVGYSTTYYDFIYNWVSRYGDSVDRLTIENEVNAANFWSSTATDYLKILTTARKAAMDANPDVLVFESGMGSGSWAVAIAEDRYDSAEWTWQEARDYMRAYYARDVYVQDAYGTLLANMNSEFAVQNFFNRVDVQNNNQRVYAVLDNLYSNDLGILLVDGLNIKFTSEEWFIDDLVAWIEARIAAGVPRTARGVLPLPIVNNEASNWCIDLSDYDPTSLRCDLTPSDGPLLAMEMIRKVVRGIHAGVEQSLWFPLSNANITSTPRIGLYDYDGNRLDTADAFAQMARFIGWSRDYTRLDTYGNVQSHVFTERALARADVRVLWWDNGGHGTGSSVATLEVPEGTVRAMRYTQIGDSTMLSIVPGSPSTVAVTVTAQPTFVYFDDGVTPVYQAEPVPAPVPASVVLAAPAPNPASGAVRIQFGVPSAVARAVVDVFDMAGRRVLRLYDGSLTEGVYRVSWDGRNAAGVEIAAGTYLVRLATGDGERHVRKIVRVR